MFLNQLPTQLHKALFLELAILVMMASHEDDTSEQISKFTSDEVLEKFLASISSKEAEMLQEYQNELFGSEHEHEELFNFVKYSLSQLFEAFDSNLNPSLIYDPYPPEILIFSYDDDDNDLEKKYAEQFPAFWRVLEESINDILEKNADNTDTKQEVMQYLICKGENILTLTPEKIRASMASLPQIKQEILKKSVKTIFEHKKEMGLTLSVREQKIILCELIGAAYSSGAFETEEKQLINTICQVCSFDSEYIEEFDIIMSTLFKINKDLAELINE